MARHKCSSPWCGECVSDSWATPEAEAKFAEVDAQRIDCQVCGDLHQPGACPGETAEQGMVEVRRYQDAIYSNGWNR